MGTGEAGGGGEWTFYLGCRFQNYILPVFLAECSRFLPGSEQCYGCSVYLLKDKWELLLLCNAWGPVSWKSAENKPAATSSSLPGAGGSAEGPWFAWVTTHPSVYMCWHVKEEGCWCEFVFGVVLLICLFRFIAAQPEVCYRNGNWSRCLYLNQIRCKCYRASLKPWTWFSWCVVTLVACPENSCTAVPIWVSNSAFKWNTTICRIANPEDLDFPF